MRAPPGHGARSRGRYTGVFYYNHGRLIVPLAKLPKQTESNTGSIMMTTMKKLTIYGHCIVGVVREGFLTPAHNKAGYVAETCVLPRAWHVRMGRACQEGVPEGARAPARLSRHGSLSYWGRA